MRPGIIPAPIARQPWGVILPLIALVLFGSAVLYSAAGGNLRPWALTHVMRFGVFLVMALLITRLPRDLFKLSAYPVYGILVVLLVLVDLIGGIGGGSQRWLNLGFMTLQPSELMKPGIVLAFARFYADLPARADAEAGARCFRRPDCSRSRRRWSCSSRTWAPALAITLRSGRGDVHGRPAPALVHRRRRGRRDSRPHRLLHPAP
jgi:hypothetical protein